jgi:enoyl-CoA hydratase/carnithine racemase
MKDYQTIHFKEEESIGFITLNRPEKLNAFTTRMMAEMLDAFDYIDSEDAIKAVIITGAGRAFCAGADLSGGADTFNSEFDTSGDYEADFRRDSGGILTLRMYNCLKPIVIACNGDAVGIGASLQLAADIRVASSNSRFGFVFAKRGIVPDACASWFLPRIVGISKALELCFSGEIFGAKEALSFGLINYIFEPDELIDQTKQITKKLISNTAPVSVALTRHMIWDMSSAPSPEDAHVIDSKAIDSRGASDDAVEGVMSFLEKREAKYTNKISRDMPSFFPWRKSKIKDHH